MIYIPLMKQLLDARNKSDALAAQAQKQAADLDYIAMMSDIELEQEGEDE